MTFHKGNQIAVSVILISTILFRVSVFHFVSYEKEASLINMAMIILSERNTIMEWHIQIPLIKPVECRCR